MDKLVTTLGIDSLSRSRVSRMAADLDQLVDGFRHRHLDAAGRPPLKRENRWPSRPGGRAQATLPIDPSARPAFGVDGMPGADSSVGRRDRRR
jgi:hypothetical protein